MSAPRRALKPVSCRTAAGCICRTGPIDLIVEAVGAPAAVEAAYRAAARAFRFVLDELCAELPALRSPASRASPRVSQVRSPDGWKRPPRLMRRRLSSRRWPPSPEASRTRSLPRCARRPDAGSPASPSTTAAISRLWLAPGETTTVGLVDRPDRPSLFARARLAAGRRDWRDRDVRRAGRSFSLGVADAVTILARDAPPKPTPPRPWSPTRSTFRAMLASGGAPACSLQPDSDLGDTAGDPFRRRRSTRISIAARARQRPRRRGEPGRARLIAAAALHLQGETRVAAPPRFERRPRQTV